MRTKMSEIVDAEVVLTSTEWADVIRDDLGRAVEGIVAAGKHLIAAKADVAHGEWLPMLKEVGISEAEASRLRSIARRFADLPSLEDLPRSVSALYELSRLDPSDIEDGIESGDINPDMTIKDAKDFANPTVNKGTGEVSDDYEPEDDIDFYAEANDIISRVARGELFKCAQCEGVWGNERKHETESGDMCDECYWTYSESQSDPEDDELESYEASWAKNHTPKRTPLYITARSAGVDLDKATRRITKVMEDDRLNKNKEQVAELIRVYLSDAVKVCKDALDQLS